MIQLHEKTPTDSQVIKVLLGGLFLERKSKMIQNIPQSQNAQSPESFDGKETLKGISLKT